MPPDDPDEYDPDEATDAIPPDAAERAAAAEDAGGDVDDEITVPPPG